MITNPTDSPLRIVTIGEESVGKTSITNRLVEGTFNPYEPGTIGANYQQYSRVINNEKLDIQIWDTAGQEKFKSLSPIYFRNAAAAVVVFALTSKTSFQNLNTWIGSFTDAAGNDALIYIAANKSDLVDDFEVTYEEAQEWADAHKYKIFYTSAKNGEGIEPLFDELTLQLYEIKLSKAHVNSTTKIREGGNKCC